MGKEGRLLGHEVFEDGSQLWYGEAGDPEVPPEDPGPPPDADADMEGPSMEETTEPFDPVAAGLQPPIDHSDDLPEEEAAKPLPIWSTQEALAAQALKDAMEAGDVEFPYLPEPIEPPSVDIPETPPSDSAIYVEDVSHDSPLYTEDVLEDFA